MGSREIKSFWALDETTLELLKFAMADMKLSARNQIKGKIVELHKGQTTAHVLIDIRGCVRITSSITNDAVDDLGLKTGDDVHAVIKASDVMVAK